MVAKLSVALPGPAATERLTVLHVPFHRCAIWATLACLLIGAVSPSGALVLCRTAGGTTAVEWAHPSSHHHGGSRADRHVACESDQPRHGLRAARDRGCEDERLWDARTRSDWSSKRAEVSVHPLVKVLSPLRALSAPTDRSPIFAAGCLRAPRSSDDLRGVILQV